MSARAHLQGKGQRTAADIYRALEGKTVDEVVEILGVTRYTVKRAARAYGVRFAGLDVRKHRTRPAASMKPDTRAALVCEPYAPQGERYVSITLPKEPWI